MLEINYRTLVSGHEQAVVLISQSRRVFANYIASNGKFFLTDGPLIVDGSVLNNVSRDDFSVIAESMLTSYCTDLVK